LKLSLGQEMPTGLVIAVAAAVLAVGVGLIWSFSGPADTSAQKAELICGHCGHRFWMTGAEHRKALAESTGPTVLCPKCKQPGVEPVLAVCGHCGKPIRAADLDPSSKDFAEKLCPFCRAPMPRPQPPH